VEVGAIKSRIEEKSEGFGRGEEKGVRLLS
jgi:hypothetical protein